MKKIKKQNKNREQTNKKKTLNNNNDKEANRAKSNSRKLNSFIYFAPHNP